MKGFLTKTIPLLAHFEHATVVVVGGEYVIAHFANVVVLLATVVVFVIFHLVKEST